MICSRIAPAQTQRDIATAGWQRSYIPALFWLRSNQVITVYFNPEQSLQNNKWSCFDWIVSKIRSSLVKRQFEPVKFHSAGSEMSQIRGFNVTEVTNASHPTPRHHLPSDLTHRRLRLPRRTPNTFNLNEWLRKSDESLLATSRCCLSSERVGSSGVIDAAAASRRHSGPADAGQSYQ